jgi:hypothetical protein
LLDLSTCFEWALAIAPEMDKNGKTGGVNAAARKLGVSRAEAQRAVKVSKLSPKAKDTAQDPGRRETARQRREGVAPSKNLEPLPVEPQHEKSGLDYMPKLLSLLEQFPRWIEIHALILRAMVHSLEQRKHGLPLGFPLSDSISRNKPNGERARNDVLLVLGGKLVQHYTHGFSPPQIGLCGPTLIDSAIPRMCRIKRPAAASQPLVRSCCSAVAASTSSQEWPHSTVRGAQSGMSVK